MEKYTKAIIALAGVLLPFLEQVGVALPEFLTVDWVQGIILALTPLLVFWFPNKENGQNVATRSPAWVGILAILLSAALMSGCSGTRAAYSAASGLEENAKVVGEHYYALVREANALKDSGALTGSALARAQTLVRDTRPAIIELSNVAERYSAVQSAENAADLEAAINEAAIAVSRLIDVIRQRTNSSLEHMRDDIDRILLTHRRMFDFPAKIAA